MAKRPPAAGMALISGGGGPDTLPGTAAVDTVQAFGGDDSLVSSQGADTLDGGAGFDFVDYIDDTTGVDVDIDAGTARDGWGDTDRLIAIEHVRGSFLDDVIRGDEGYNYLDGEDGDDTLNARYGDDGLRGGGGDDVLIGGGLFDLDDPAAFAEYDFADYRGTANAVTIDLAHGTVYGGAGAGNDVLIGIESARGSAFADTFYGGSGADFEGFVGGGGDDRIHGDGVTNTRAEYWDAAGGVTITLNAAGNGTATGSGVGTDLLFDVNFFRGSSFADRFDASAFANGVGGGDFNHFQGDAGNDTVVGNGNTRIDYRSATIGVTVDLQVGTAADGLGGVDSFHGVNQIRGSSFADTLRGGADDDYEGFEGRGGDDRIDGRSGFDEAIYSLDGVPPSGISVDLAAGIVVGDPSTSGTDTLISVEAVRGTIVDDLFDATGFAGGDAAANGPGTAVDHRFNVFEGMAGDDTVSGNGHTAISYLHAATGVTVTFTSAGAGGSSGDYHTGADTFTGVEGVLGSDADDTFFGSDDPSSPDTGYFEFFAGNGGDDHIDGGGGVDLAHYGWAEEGVVVDLGAGSASGGASTGTDVLVDIEAVHGSRFDDTLRGGSAAAYEFFVGGAGDDLIDGLGGRDIVSFLSDAAGVVVDLDDQSSNRDGSGGVDTYAGIEEYEGSAFADTMRGGLDDDLFCGAGGDDSLHGGAGGDTLYGGAGSDLLDGGADEDVVDYRANADRIVGTGTPALYGGSTNIVTEAFGDVDSLIAIETLFATDHDDTLDGGFDLRVVYGGAGDDTVSSVYLDNTFYGEAGDDVLAGGAGGDTLYGGGDDDSLAGDGASDTLYGEDGDDSLDSGIGFDELYGGIGDDTLDAAASGGAYIEGGSGNDTATGGAGNDAAYGGDDDDTISGAGSDDTLHGDGGRDSIAGDDGLDSLFGGDDADSLDGGGGDDSLSGDAGDDTLGGGGGRDSLDGGVDNDSLAGGLDGDSLYGGDGDDWLFGDGDADALYGGGEVDAAFGGDDGDSIYGGEGDDTLHGEGGRDSLSGDRGVDILFGDDDDDELSGGGDGDSLDGGRGADVLFGDDGDDVVAGNDDDDTAYGGFDDDTVFGGGGFDLLYGDDGDDSIYGGIDDDTASGQAGQDYLAGDEGADSLDGGAEDDVLDGGAGDDTLSGGDGDDDAYGGADRDTLYGDALDDALYGGGDDDSIYGGAENDSLHGDDGWDRLEGGDGDDYFVTGFGSDYVDGGDGEDVVDYSGELGPVVGSIFAVLYGGSTNIVTEAFGDVDSLIAIETVLGSDNDDTFWDGFDVRVIDGRWGRDTIAADALENTIYGGEDDDTISGGLGDDSLYGGGGWTDWVDYRDAWDAVTVDFGLGEATILATGEFDVIGDFEAVFGSDYDDTLRGASGFTFETFVGGGGNDVIDGDPDGYGGFDAVSYQYDPGSVTIDLWEGTAVDGYGATDTLSDLYYYIGSSFDDTMSGEGPDIIDFGLPGPLAAIWYGVQFFGLDGNDTLTGGDGADVLDGGSGNDTMTGGGGDDVYVVDSVDDVVVEYAEGGRDTALVTFDYTLDIALEDLRAVSFGDLTLTGNSNDNEIQGINYSFPGFLAGDETLRGLDGNDTLFGFDGDDLLDGGLDDDSIYGGDGNDTIRFADAALATLDVVEVTIAGGAGSATGAAGLDIFTGIEALLGGDEIDRFTGWDQADTFDGGGGDDQLVGAGGNDTLRGGDGDDRLFGGAGNDTLTGGYGDDFYRLDDGDIVDETSPGTAGHDTVWVSFTNYTLPDGVEVGAVNFAGPAILTGEGDRNTLFGDASADTLFGLGGSDYLYGFASGDSLYGGTGDDFLFGGTGGDTLVGGQGNDYYRLDDAGADTVVEALDDGTDQVWVGFSGHTIAANVEWGILNFDGDGDLTGNAIDNTLYGTDGVNTLYGGGGNDNLLGYAGADALHGDAGDDVLQGGLGADTLYGGIGNDAFIGGGGAANTYFGGAGDDFYRIDAATDLVDETGGSGTDTVWVSLDIDYVATAGIEVIAANNAALDMDLTGNAIDNLIQGNDAVNVLSGAGGNDTLQGFGGADTLVGGAGRDVLSGGSGADVFAYALGDGNDVIVDFNFAEGDRIDLTGIVYIGNGATADVAILSADGGVTTFTLSANNGYNWTGAEFI